jgi:hypothetical protein
MTRPALLLAAFAVGWLLIVTEVVSQSTVLIVSGLIAIEVLLIGVDEHRAKTLAALARIEAALDDLKNQR